MLERDRKQSDEGSGEMLFQLLKSILMILPQSLCYRVLRDRLVSVSKFRQSTMIRTSSTKVHIGDEDISLHLPADTKSFVARTHQIRKLHCLATWQTIRQDSLEVIKQVRTQVDDEGADRRSWLGYADKEEQAHTERGFRDRNKQNYIEDVTPGYHEMGSSGMHIQVKDFDVPPENNELDDDGADKAGDKQWKDFWAKADH